MLAVGDSFRDPKLIADWVRLSDATPVAFCDFDVEVLRRVDPDVVLTSLVSPSHDCTDVAQTLSDAEFTGQFRVVCGPLPRPELVSDELRITFPSLDIDLWILPTK